MGAVSHRHLPVWRHQRLRPVRQRHVQSCDGRQRCALPALSRGCSVSHRAGCSRLRGRHLLWQQRDQLLALPARLRVRGPERCPQPVRCGDILNRRRHGVHQLRGGHVCECDGQLQVQHVSRRIRVCGRFSVPHRVPAWLGQSCWRSHVHSLP